MNLTLIKMMKGYLVGMDEKYLLHLLDRAEKVADLDTIEPDTDESEELVSNENSEIDAEKNALHEEQIKTSYVSLMVLEKLTYFD